MPPLTKVEKEWLAKVKVAEDPDRSKVVELWCDGGVLKKNPSPYGGTWAFCGVDPMADELIYGESALVLAPDGLFITNNDTEIMAVIKALESVPEGWAGRVFTDSQVTIRRFELIAQDKPEWIKRIPRNILLRAMQAFNRAGELTWILVKGHPERQDLEIGYYEKDLVRGYETPRVVSKYNIWCDAECGKHASQWKEEQQ